MTLSSTPSSSFSVAVTPDDLARALDKMGLTESVSAASLYDTILQLRSDTALSLSHPPKTTPDQTQSAKDSQQDQGSSDQPRQFNTARPALDLHDPVRVEKRRIMRERVKAQYPNGPPPLIGLYGDKWSGGGTDIRGNHGTSGWL